MVTIELAREADAAAAAAVHAETASFAYAGIFPPDMSSPSPAALEPDWLGMIERPGACVLVARIDGDVVGAAAIRMDDALPAGVRLARLYVRPTDWGRGHGARLHDEALATACRWGYETVNLWVLADNRRGRAWYERRGWTHVPGPVLENDPPHILDVLYQRRL